MAKKIYCRYCGQPVEIPDDYPSKEVNCPACAKMFTISTASISQSISNSRSGNLHYCNDCNNLISKNAPLCPHCGRQYKGLNIGRISPSIINVFLIVLGVLFSLGLILFLFYFLAFLFFGVLLFIA